MCVDCLQNGFVMYNDKLILCKKEAIPPIPDYVIPEDCCKKNACIITFKTDDMTSKFEFFSKNKTNNLYLNESM